MDIALNLNQPDGVQHLASRFLLKLDGVDFSEEHRDELVKGVAVDVARAAGMCVYVYVYVYVYVFA